MSPSKRQPLAEQTRLLRERDAPAATTHRSAGELLRHTDQPAASVVAGGMPSPRRLRSVKVIAWIMAGSAIAFGLLTAVFGIVSPEQEVHAFHNAVVASLLLVLSAPPAVAVARSPERPTMPLSALTALAVAGLVTMALGLTVDPFTMPFVLLTGVLWALRPSREPLLPAGRPSRILLALVLAGAVPLLGYALGQAEFQRVDTVSSHDAFFHWVETSFYAVAVLMLGGLAALRPASYRLAAWSAGLALAVLGAASLLLGSYASALDGQWALAALVGGGVFVGAAAWEARRADSVLNGTRALRV
jgi:hypothetical protein